MAISLTSSMMARLIEIQTGSFALDQRQVTALAQTHQVLLAYPVALESWLVQPTPDGARPTCAGSPPRARCLALFSELVSFPGWPDCESQLRDRYRVHARGRILRHQDAPWVAAPWLGC